MKIFYSFLFRYPKVCIALLLAITAGLAIPASKIQVKYSHEDLMTEGDADRRFFDKVMEIFGNDEVIVLAVVDNDTVFSFETLTKIRRISNRLEEMNGVESVFSLTTVFDIVSINEGVEVRKLVDGIPETSRAMAPLRKAALENELFRKNLVSENGKAAAINVFIEERPGDDAYRREIVDGIREIVEREKGPESIYVAGIPYTSIMLERRQNTDMAIFTPITLLLIAAVLFFFFRSIRGVLIPLVTVGAATVWTLGIMSLLGKTISPITSTIPTIVMTIGTAYTIHLLSQYYGALRNGDMDRAGLVRVFASTAVPVALTAVTTLAGFAAIAANRIPAIRDFGISGIAGIFSVGVLSLTLVPSLLATLKAKLPAGAGKETGKGSGKWLERLADFNLRYRRGVIAASVLLFSLGLLGLTRLKVDTDYIHFLKQGDPVTQDLRKLEESFAGTIIWNIVLEGDKEDTFKDPGVLRAMNHFQSYLDDQAWIDKSTSFLDYLKWIYGAIQGDKTETNSIPGSAEAVSQSLLLYSFSDQETLDRLVTSDFSMANIVVRCKNMGSTEIKKHAREVEAYARKTLPPGLRAEVTGTAYFLVKTADQIAMGQVTSLSIAMVIIFCIMWLTFSSLKTALISLLPNMIPLGILFGIMGWLGIPLNMATSLIAAVVLGIAVDDTIHYMVHFNRELKKTSEEEKAMRNSIVDVGAPMIMTTVALCAGFCVLCLSNYVPVIYFGFLSALIIGICLLADILFLPSVLLTTKSRDTWLPRPRIVPLPGFELKHR